MSQLIPLQLDGLQLEGKKRTNKTLSHDPIRIGPKMRLITLAEIPTGAIKKVRGKEGSSGEEGFNSLWVVLPYSAVSCGVNSD